MRSRQKKKLKNIIFYYYNARALCLCENFSPKSIKNLQKRAQRYKKIKTLHRKTLLGEIYGKTLDMLP
jgi:hypothetical protein